MHDPRQRKPRFRRESPQTTVQLTDRDFRILDLVSRHRFLRSDHLTKLVTGSPQHVVRRLGRLYHAGLLERPRHQLHLPDRHGPIIYCLTERGRKELESRGFAVFPSAPRLRSAGSAFLLGHDLRVSDVLVAIQANAAKNSPRLRLHHEWAGLEPDEPKEKLHPLQWRVRLDQSSDRRPLHVIPDAAFSLESSETDAAFFLLEVDRGTMPVTRSNISQTSFIRKVQAYRETRQAGILWKRWEIPGFRVLVVAETRKRMESLQRATAKCFRYGRSTMFLFAVAEDLLQATNPCDGPWQTCSGDPAILIAQQPTESVPGQPHPVTPS